LLTVDLVRARRRGEELRIVSLDEPTKARAVEIADTYLATMKEHVGRRRDEIDEALSAEKLPADEVWLGDALAKLIEDRATFEAGESSTAEELRRETFLLSAKVRRELGDDEAFDRDRVIGEIAARRQADAATIESSLYADLRGAQRLLSVEPVTAEEIVSRFDRAQAQAVLLRAVEIAVHVRCASPAGYRALFRRLKFLRLLFRIAPHDDDGYLLSIDGPFSLFESVTKYGLSLAMVLPVLEEHAAYKLVASVRWGKDRRPLVFRYSGGVPVVSQQVPGSRQKRGIGGIVAPRLPDDVEKLVDAFRRMEGPWTAKAASKLLEVSGVGVIAPDLVFEHGETKQKVYLEVLGYWSREAVFRRVDLAMAGLRERVLFAVSERLRVSEEVLGPEVPSALYVYKGTMNARAVERKLSEIAGR
jgi:uncharacterized protein